MTTKTTKNIAAKHIMVDEKDVSPTFVIDYKTAAEKFDLTTQPRRPNRCAPIQEPALEDELAMWEDASDEALENFEGLLDSEEE